MATEDAQTHNAYTLPDGLHAQVVGAFGEAAVAFDPSFYEDYANALSGPITPCQAPGPVLAVDNEQNDVSALDLIEQLLNRSDIDADQRIALEDLRRDIVAGRVINPMAAVTAIQTQITSSNTAQDTAQDSAEAAAAEALERDERERRRLYDEWFDGDEEAVNRMMQYDNIAIYSDDADARAAANAAAEADIRAHASSAAEADQRIADRRGRIAAGQEQARLLSPEIRETMIVPTAQGEAQSLSQAVQQDEALNAALGARLSGTTENTPPTEPHATAALGLVASGVTTEPTEAEPVPTMPPNTTLAQVSSPAASFDGLS